MVQNHFVFYKVEGYKFLSIAEKITEKFHNLVKNFLGCKSDKTRNWISFRTNRTFRLYNPWSLKDMNLQYLTA